MYPVAQIGDTVTFDHGANRLTGKVTGKAAFQCGAVFWYSIAVNGQTYTKVWPEQLVQKE